MRIKARKTEWVDDIAALTQMYLHSDVIRQWVDTVAKTPEVYWSWGNRALPQAVMAAGGSYSDLLVAPDPIIFRSSRRFEKVTYSYYPAQFLLDYHEELRNGAKWAASSDDASK